MNLIPQQFLNLPGIDAAVAQQQAAVQAQQEAKNRNAIAPYLLMQAQRQAEKGDLEIEAYKNDVARKNKLQADLIAYYAQQDQAPQAIGGQPPSNPAGPAANMPTSAPVDPHGRMKEIKRLQDEAAIMRRNGMTDAADKKIKQSFDLVQKMKEQKTLMRDGKPVVVNFADDGTPSVVEGFDPTPKVHWTDNGQRIQGVNEYTMQPMGDGIQRQATPESMLTDARTRSEGAANRAVTTRGQNMIDARSQHSNALKARELEQSQSSGLPVLGVPVPTVTPWANQSNAKDANKVKLNEMTRGAKEVEKDNDQAKKVAEVAQSAKRFMELNKSINTGGVTDKFALGRLAQSFGADYAEMEALTAQLAPQNRVEGSGATSDYDAKQFERATMGVDKPVPANTNIGTALIAKAQMVQDYAEFRNTYLEQNGTLLGADRYWKQYANSNPIFDKKAGEGSYVINADRKNWREYFKGDANQSASGSDAAPRATSTAPEMKRSELDAMPSPAKVKVGSVITDQAGIKYKSDGKNWVRQ